MWETVWIILMILWICFGVYSNWAPDNRTNLPGTLIPWFCVLILGLIIFGQITVKLARY